MAQGFQRLNDEKATEETIDIKIKKNFFYSKGAGVINNGSGFHVQNELDFMVDKERDVKIKCHYVWSYNQNTDFISKLVLCGDGVEIEIGETRERPSAISGRGEQLPDSEGETSNTGTNKKHNAYIVDVFTLPKGIYKLQLHFMGQNPNRRAAVHKSTLEAELK